MRAILVPILTLIIAIALAAIEDLVLGVFINDWRLWLVNGCVATVLAFGIAYLYEKWRFKAINGQPK